MKRVSGMDGMHVKPESSNRKLTIDNSACNVLPDIGLDLGSRRVKLAFRTAETGELKLYKYDTLTFYREFAVRSREGFCINFEKLGLGPVGKIVVTGYGRNNLELQGAQVVTEITAHAVGASVQSGLDNFICLDLGGQDSKIIRVEKGAVTDFQTNDKCAAGSGRYLESMAAILGVELSELGKYWENPVRLSSTCAIFGESEMIGRIVEGYPWEELCAGINRSVYVRIRPWLLAYKPEVIVFTGGVAKNQAIVRMISEHQEVRVIVPEHPEYNGAIGCLHVNL
ncbi:MAG: acyl-CoA dehydratase activase [bacterium]|nr:acyl-CoA dehydratase activase [bacterium]